MRIVRFILAPVLALTSLGCIFNSMENSSEQGLAVKRCEDFTINGKGDHSMWDQAEWVGLDLLSETENPVQTELKILYSETGIYLLAYCQDNKISTEYDVDQDDVWEGDVFEAFFQTEESAPLYFEYEINPLGAELVLLVPNNNGDFMGWSPWHYEGERKIIKKVIVEGGPQESGAEIKSWTAEMFFPFALFKGLENVPPKSGTKWKANFYRMDYDTGERAMWAWRPVDINFHQYEKYGTLFFQ